MCFNIYMIKDIIICIWGVPMPKGQSNSQSRTEQTPVPKSWAEIVGRLPARLLTIMAALACFALVLFIAAMLDSVYRTKEPIWIAGQPYGHTARAIEEQAVERLKGAINTEFAKLNTGASNDGKSPITNSSGKNGAGFEVNGQGRCPDGEMIVGLQPMASSEGSSLRYQCGKLPQLKIP